MNSKTFIVYQHTLHVLGFFNAWDFWTPLYNIEISFAFYSNLLLSVFGWGDIYIYPVSLLLVWPPPPPFKIFVISAFKWLYPYIDPHLYTLPPFSKPFSLSLPYLSFCFPYLFVHYIFVLSIYLCENNNDTQNNCNLT